MRIAHSNHLESKMEHLTALTLLISFSGENWLDPLEDAVRSRVRAFIEALVEEEAQAPPASLRNPFLWIGWSFHYAGWATN
jgi:hypothetical protein